MSLNISNPSHTTPISHNIVIGLPVRRFVQVDYALREPERSGTSSAASHVPQDRSDPTWCPPSDLYR